MSLRGMFEAFRTLWAPTPSAIYVFEDGIQVTQVVELVPGEPMEVRPGEFKRYLDTCRVRYILESRSDRLRDECPTSVRVRRRRLPGVHRRIGTDRGAKRGYDPPVVA